MVGLDQISRGELGARWAYRHDLERTAALRFQRLARRLAEAGFDSGSVLQTTQAAEQERHHVDLCGALAMRFGYRETSIQELSLPDIAPASFSPRDRVIYEMVAFCCIAESANAAVVLAGIDDVEDPQVRASVRTILSDEVEHSRIGWQFLAAHDVGDSARAWLGAYLPDMLRGTVRADLFAPAIIVGDEAAMQKFGTLPIADRRSCFLEVMRTVVFPGLTEVGVDTSQGAHVLDEFERLQSLAMPLPLL
jgi:hypothetical protein